MATNRDDISSKTPPAQGEAAGTPHANVVSSERAVQDRVVGLMRERLGYGYWGNLKGQDNGNINAAVLEGFLAKRQNLTPAQAGGVVARLRQAAACPSKAALYKANKEVYRMLRYPVPVPTEPGKPQKQAWLVDWKKPSNNVFSIAEEVRVPAQGGDSPYRQPDVCVYVNGILFAVIELKKATVSSDHEERVKLYKDVQKRVIEDAPYILLFQSKTVVPMRSNVKGYVYNPMLESMYNFEAMSKD